MSRVKVGAAAGCENADAGSNSAQTPAAINCLKHTIVPSCVPGGVRNRPDDSNRNAVQPFRKSVSVRRDARTRDAVPEIRRIGGDRTGINQQGAWKNSGSQVVSGSGATWPGPSRRVDYSRCELS